jgi:hypothetical protein
VKIVLSRKGLDSSFGNVANPILPDGGLCPLPIPAERGRPLRKIHHDSTTLGEIARQISRGRIDGRSRVHHDPDLCRGALPRECGWRPCLGQVGAAQKHLENQGVGVGDLFLFFGWFRRTVLANGELRFAPGGESMHVIFGWLQVGAFCKPSAAKHATPRWAHDHPHVVAAARYPANNTLYVASRTLACPGLERRLPGGGFFPRFAPELRLTAPGQSRGVWRVPGWWWPEGGPPALSYHGDEKRWRRGRQDLLLRTVGRGQEFVLEVSNASAATEWLREIFRSATALGSMAPAPSS